MIPDQTAGEPVTEYGIRYPGGTYRILAGSPYWALADRIRHGLGDGSGTRYGRRRVVVVEDWEEITGAPAAGEEL